MAKYLLSVDNGGTYIKAAIFDVHGRQVGIERTYNRTISPKPGYCEYDQEQLWQTNCTSIKKVISTTGISPAEIACIGISAQGCGFYAVDERGRDIRNAITSADARAKGYAERWLRDGTSKQQYAKTFRYTSAGHLNSILAWLKENEPSSYARIGRIFSMKDYLIYRLTGNAIAGCGCQSASCLMDLNTGKFDPALFEAFGIAECADKFGALMWDSESCGKLTQTAAAQTGCAVGTRVCAGAHDVVASAIAMGVINSEPVFMITGTHGINGYISPVPILNGSILYNEYFAFPGMFLIEEGYPASSATLEWVIRVFFAGEMRSKRDIYAEINALVDSVDPQEHCPVFLPFLRGQRDNPDARGAWVGLCPEHTRAHMLRAVFEGVVFSHIAQAEHLFRNRARPQAVRIAGGAVHSPVWMRIFADAMQLPVDIVSGEEMGAKGAAILAAVCAGVYPDIPSAVARMCGRFSRISPRAEYSEAYAAKYAAFKRAVEAANHA